MIRNALGHIPAGFESIGRRKMAMNLIGVWAFISGVLVVALAYRNLRGRSRVVRFVWLAVCGLLAFPSVLFAVYYLHVLPEWVWFYTLRSYIGTEFLVIFLGGVGGAAAALLPRLLCGVPFGIFLVLAVIPYVKPLVRPIPDRAFQERWQGEACLQSTPSTCGPASVCTILKRLGRNPSERAAARESYSDAGGTEAWYLARYVRRQGFVARFDFRETFSATVGLPAMVGVRFGGAGHFIAVLAVDGDRVTFADPLRGEEQLSMRDFRRRYVFTGFHLVITKA